MGEAGDLETLNLLRRHLKGLLVGIEMIINKQVNKKTGESIKRIDNRDKKPAG